MAETTSSKPAKVLVVEASSREESPVLREKLKGSEQFEAVWARNLEEALECLEQNSFDIILLDLALADSNGLNLFSQIALRVPEIPIVVVDGSEDKARALEVLREGAQDYLVNEDLDTRHLQRALLFAIERHRTRVMLRQLTFNDDLTGLLNRRGFMSLAKQQMKIAQRENWELILLFADLDGLKHINDNFGHPEGDRALQAVANILRETFRTSDLIARLGGDEFIILAINVPAPGIKVITTRLQENLARYNAQSRYYPLTLSFGVVQFNPQREVSLDEVIVKADKALYENKRTKVKVSVDTPYRGVING